MGGNGKVNAQRREAIGKVADALDVSRHWATAADRAIDAPPQCEKQERKERFSPSLTVSEVPIRFHLIRRKRDEP